MTKKQAFLAALRCEQPDVVPVSPLIHYRYARELLGRWDWRAVFDVHQQLGSTHYRGPVHIGVTVDGMDGYETRDEVIFEAGAHRVTRTTLLTPQGTLTSTHDIGLIPEDPLVGKVMEHFVKEPKEWEILIRMWNGMGDSAEVAPDTSIAEACRVMGEEGVASVGVGSAYQQMGRARGMGELLLDLIDQPDLMREVAGAAWRRQERVLDAFLASAAEVCFYDICWATGSHMGPDMFEQWVGDEIRRACAKVRDAGKYISFYTLGRIGELMDCMVDAHPHMIASFEPNEGDISLADAKKRYGDRICLMGNVDCVVLARGTVAEARAEARRCLDEAMEGGGYILGSADEVPSDAKYDNLRAMVDVAHEHGRYA